MEVIGHRGAAALAPENTWAGFDIALSLGVDAIETDVRATSDGKLVLFHDALLDRTTNGKGFVHAVSWHEMSQLDAGSWFGRAFEGEKIPLLYDTLVEYGRRTHFALEIKQPGVEDLVLEAVRFLGLVADVTFTSFDFAVVSKIRQAAPNARVGYLTSDTSYENVVRTFNAGIDQFCPPAGDLSQVEVTMWKKLGVLVRAWGVGSVEDMTKAIEAGVDGMTIDFPHLLLEKLGRGTGIQQKVDENYFTS